MPKLEKEDGSTLHSTLAGVPAGAAIVRDPRTWHGGTPNVSDERRAMPNALFFAPWYSGLWNGGKKQISPEMYAKLSPHGQRIARGILRPPQAAL